MEQKDFFEQSDASLSEDELNKATGGGGLSNGSFYGLSSCPGPERCSLLRCRHCRDLGTGPMHKVGNIDTIYMCNHK